MDNLVLVCDKLIKESELIKIYSRDCRSDDTKEWFGLIDEDEIVLYKKMKRLVKDLNGIKRTFYSYDRYVPIDILETGIFCLGTSIYSLS